MRQGGAVVRPVPLAKPIDGTVKLSFDACARHFLNAGKCGHRLCAREQRQRPRQRMTRIKRQFGGDLQIVGVDGLDIDQSRLTECQRAGLVENRGVHLGHPLHGGTVLDHDAVFKQAARRNHLHNRHCKGERARTGDDEGADGDIDRAIPVTAGIEHPADEGEKGDGVDHWHVEFGSAVGKTAIIGPPAFRHIHQPHHFGEEGILGFGRCANDERRGKIERACANIRTGADRHGIAFARCNGAIEF